MQNPFIAQSYKACKGELKPNKIGNLKKNLKIQLAMQNLFISKFHEAACKEIKIARKIWIFLFPGSDPKEKYFKASLLLTQELVRQERFQAPSTP